MSFADLSLPIAFSVGGLLIVALLSRKEHRKANLLLSGIIAGGLYFQFVSSLKVTGAILNQPLLWRSLFPAAFLVNGLLYLYVLALTEPGFQFSRRRLLYLLPFFFGLVWYGVLQMVPRSSPLWIDRHWILGERYLRSVISFLVSGVFLYACFRRLHEYQKRVKSYFSEIRRVRLQWLRNLLILFVVPWLIGGLDVLTGPAVTFERIIVPAVTLMILLIGFFGLRQSVIFTSEDLLVEKERVPETETPSKGKEPLFFTEEKLIEWKDKLERYMSQEKPYLDPELRLVDLAKGLGLKGYQVSEILNRGMRATFYDLINRYRVEEAKSRLRDPAFAHMNILGIATDSGFNSKSVFNEVFRKAAGMTPSEFRKGK